MVRLADIVRRHGPAYRARFGASMLPSHVRALDAIATCRTPVLGGHLAACGRCGREHLLFHSCGHRACPQCGHDATARWLLRQRALLLPVPYFHVVFTLPAELRRLVRTHQRVLLPLLARAAFDALAALCADPRFVGARVGALAVLHTWSRTLEWHPHVHLLVPGGGVAPDGTWRMPPRRRAAFLVPVRALAARFRGNFLRLARRALPATTTLHAIPPGKRWVVFAKSVARGANRVLDYLGRYVRRTATTDKAIVGLDEHTVTFRYRESRTGERKTMTLPAHEWLRRFLQHVLPKGMHRVRAFGLLHPEHRPTLRALQILLAPKPAPEPEPPTPRPPRRCPHCGHRSVELVRRLAPEHCLALAALLAVPFARGPPPSSAPEGMTS